MGIIGFMVGALIVYLLRALQGLTPIWDAGVGMTLAAFTSAGFFVWGMGGFDPRMSVHGEEAEHHDEPEETPQPMALLASSTWQIVTLLLGFVLVIAAIAWVPFGPALTITADPLASRTGIGFVDVDLFGIQIPQVSELVIFAIVVIVMILSLVAVAGFIGWLFFSLSRGVAQAQATPYTPLDRQLFQLPSGAAVVEGEAPSAPARRGLPDAVRTPLFFVVAAAAFAVLYLLVMPIIADNVLGAVVPIADDTRFFFSLAGALAIGAAVARPVGNLMALAVFFAAAFALYPIFYHVLVGLVYTAVFPSLGQGTQEAQRVIVSWLNALIIPLLVLRPLWVSRLIGRVARVLANVLRWVGTVK
jgi:hypothetical protein